MVTKLNNDAFEEDLVAETRDQGLHISRLFVDKNSISMTQPGQGTPKLMGLLILGMLVTATILVSMESYCTLQDKVEIELQQPATEEHSL